MINHIEQIVQADYTARKWIVEVGEGMTRTITELVAEAPDGSGSMIKLIEQIDQAPGSNECVREISARVARGINVVYCACKTGGDINYDTFPANLLQIVKMRIVLMQMILACRQARTDNIDAINVTNARHKVIEDLMRGQQTRVLGVCRTFPCKPSQRSVRKRLLTC